MRRIFGTDSAKPCWRCNGTIAEYTTDATITTLIDARCVGCGAIDLFATPTGHATPATAAECSALHCAS
jgi:hypothetical protein